MNSQRSSSALSIGSCFILCCSQKGFLGRTKEIKKTYRVISIEEPPQPEILLTESLPVFYAGDEFCVSDGFTRSIWIVKSDATPEFKEKETMKVPSLGNDFSGVSSSIVYALAIILIALPFIAMLNSIFHYTDPMVFVVKIPIFLVSILSVLGVAYLVANFMKRPIVANNLFIAMICTTIASLFIPILMTFAYVSIISCIGIVVYIAKKGHESGLEGILQDAYLLRERMPGLAKHTYTFPSSSASTLNSIDVHPAITSSEENDVG